MLLKFLIASGPTREPLDPVRFFSNYSTGVMGAHLAREIRRRGHRLTWVHCPEEAETARELLKKLKALITRHDVFVMAAAVSDVRPAVVSGSKIKKEALKGVRFVQNPDVLAQLGRRKRRGQVFIGFGLESSDLLRNGLKKLRQKKLDAVLLQKVTREKRPFGDTRVEAMLLCRSGQSMALGRVSKRRVAELLVRQAERLAASRAFC